MHVVPKQYSDEFRHACKAEFGLEPEQIKQILTVLCVKRCLNVDEHFKQVDSLKEAVITSSKYVQQISAFGDVG